MYDVYKNKVVIQIDSFINCISFVLSLKSCQTGLSWKLTTFILQKNIKLKLYFQGSQPNKIFGMQTSKFWNSKKNFWEKENLAIWLLKFVIKINLKIFLKYKNLWEIYFFYPPFRLFCISRVSYFFGQSKFLLLCLFKIFLFFVYQFFLIFVGQTYFLFGFKYDQYELKMKVSIF